jgi:hypothetical protein
MARKRMQLSDGVRDSIMKEYMDARLKIVCIWQVNTSKTDDTRIPTRAGSRLRLIGLDGNRVKMATAGAGLLYRSGQVK